MTPEQHADAIFWAAGNVPLDSEFCWGAERTAILAAVTAAMEDGQAELAAENARLRERLQHIVYGGTDVDLSSGFSGGGITICGDKASIKAVQRAMHDSAQLDAFRTGFDARKAELEGRIATLRIHADELAGALEVIAVRNSKIQWTATEANPETHWECTDGPYAKIARTALTKHREMK
jgi:hypothetical protein